MNHVLYLQPQGGEEGDQEFLVIDRSPYIIGRHPGNDGCISVREISGKHAEFRFHDNAWQVRDLRSTNGTRVNGNRLTDMEWSDVRMGDYVHLATLIYKITPRLSGSLEPAESKTCVVSQRSAHHDTVELLTIISDNRTSPHFQPIFEIQSGVTFGWEALGRGVGGSGPIPVSRLFEAAALARSEVQLSRCFQKAALHCAQCRHCWTNPTPLHLFMNLHPKELGETGLLPALQELAASPIRQWYQPVVEIPEAWARADVAETHRVMDAVRRLGLLVAYDDFGQGQSRLEDLMKYPPDFLKLDRLLVADLGERRIYQTITKGIVDACHRLKVKTLAEGIETPEQLEACKELGFTLGQGYLLGTPKPAYKLFNAEPATLPPTCPFVRLQLLPK